MLSFDLLNLTSLTVWKHLKNISVGSISTDSTYNNHKIFSKFALFYIVTYCCRIPSKGL